jgi:hypothetical protein
MAVPKASVYKNDLATGREHQIRLARKVGNMQSIAIPEGVGHLAHCEFGFRILGTDSRHDEGPLVAIYMVRHSPKPPDIRIWA